MYVINIFFVDSKYKASYRRGINKSVIKMLSNEKHTSTTWYTLDYSIMDKEIEKFDYFSLRWCRKFLRGISPNSTQIIYYILPLMYVLFMILRTWLFKKNE